jgi:hypothetical protein
MPARVTAHCPRCKGGYVSTRIICTEKGYKAVDTTDRCTTDCELTPDDQAAFEARALLSYVNRDNIAEDEKYYLGYGIAAKEEA